MVCVLGAMLPCFLGGMRELPWFLTHPIKSLSLPPAHSLDYTSLLAAVAGPCLLLGILTEHVIAVFFVLEVWVGMKCLLNPVITILSKSRHIYTSMVGPSPKTLCIQ